VFSEDTSEFKGNDDKPWEDLGEELKASLRDQVKNIPNALRKINYDVISVKEKPEPIEFTQKELNIIAAFEHKRWSFHRGRPAGNTVMSRMPGLKCILC
jgi:hypothetical protein